MPLKPACNAHSLVGWSTSHSLALAPAHRPQAEHAVHLAAPWCRISCKPMQNLCKTFPFSSLLTHPDSIPAMDQYQHDLNLKCNKSTQLLKGGKQHACEVETHLKFTAVLRELKGNEGHFSVFPLYLISPIQSGFSLLFPLSDNQV